MKLVSQVVAAVAVVAVVALVAVAADIWFRGIRISIGVK